MIEEYYPVRLTAVLLTEHGPALFISDNTSDKSFLVMVLEQDADMIAQILFLRHSGTATVRLTTYELFGEILAKANARLSSVRITKIDDENIFCAELDLYYGDDYCPIQARVSDAIGLAIAFEVPILVAKEVLDRVSTIHFEVVSEEADLTDFALADGGELPDEFTVDDILSEASRDDWGRDGRSN